jgi:hypothetical protein
LAKRLEKNEGWPEILKKLHSAWNRYAKDAGVVLSKYSKPLVAGFDDLVLRVQQKFHLFLVYYCDIWNSF